ncbi:MAG TPA: hypothetical protein P5233_17975 [Candidatus Paceibacterota bacterium]|nr:hypothetical protein [Verrucomicrobiota bacterium]HPC58823.1 hypothetical protein [Kiritimatiellia bacterium]HRT10275.1 hypothetical protein [Candidatus Paceibacterota bacterium]HNS70826.1 hypothetical protein [Verrucomicrobiota bacterium]HQE89723.1 hypothetical protein [Verrucomicrobiota bacterium]
MRNRLKNATRGAALLALAAGGLLGAGCRSTSGTVPPTPPGPLTPPPTSGRPGPDNMAAEASAEAVRHFNFVVTAAGTGPVEPVRQAVEGRLAQSGYKLNAEAPDIQVQLAVRAAEFDRAGGYLRYEGTTEVGVNRVWDNKRLGYDSVSVRGRRGLGADEAMRNLAAELANGTAARVMAYARPEQSGLAVQDVTIRRPWLVGRDPNTVWIHDRDPEYAQRFIAAVRQIRGVVYCAMVAHDYDQRALTFRVVYLADALPEGLLNRLANMKDLKIKPRN